MVRQAHHDNYLYLQLFTQFSPLLVLSPTSRHALMICYFKIVLKVVGDNTNNGTKNLVNLMQHKLHTHQVQKALNVIELL
jgi:hypothetical protein